MWTHNFHTQFKPWWCSLLGFSGWLVIFNAVICSSRSCTWAIVLLNRFIALPAAQWQLLTAGNYVLEDSKKELEKDAWQREGREKSEEADAKIHFFNGTIYFLVCSGSWINQLHTAAFAHRFAGTGRLGQGSATDSATDNPAPSLFKIFLPFYLHFPPYHFYLRACWSFHFYYSACWLKLPALLL